MYDDGDRVLVVDFDFAELRSYNGRAGTVVKDDHLGYVVVRLDEEPNPLVSQGYGWHMLHREIMPMPTEWPVTITPTVGTPITLWACCVSTIGPKCQHLTAPE